MYDVEIFVNGNNEIILRQSSTIDDDDVIQISPFQIDAICMALKEIKKKSFDGDFWPIITLENGDKVQGPEMNPVK
jgi:hypothetical protein